MSNKPITKIITLGHSQNGKSSLAGYIYSSSLRLLFNNDKSFLEVINNVESIRSAAKLTPNLRYALIYDGPRDDLFVDYKEGKFKTISTRPYTLQIENDNEIFELTDLPGHQSFIDRVCGSIEKSNIGIMVVDAGAIIDYIEAPGKYWEILLHKTIPMKTRKGNYPEAYLNMLYAAQAEAKKKSERIKSGRAEAQHKTIKDKIKPPTIFGIYNYLAIALHLGVTKLIVAVHKMDLGTIRFDQAIFEKVKTFIDDITRNICSSHNIREIEYDVIPTALEFNEDYKQDNEHNVLTQSREMDWYKGKTLLQALISMKNEVTKEYSCKAQNAPFRLQLNDIKLDNPSPTQGKHFMPRIFGFCHSGYLEKKQKIILPLRNSTSFIKPIRVSAIGTKYKKELSSSFPDLHFTYTLSNTDLTAIGPSKDLNKAFFVGNFAIREDEHKKNPLIFSNSIEIHATFIGGWYFKDDFNANLIYGYRRVQAIFQNLDFEHDNKSFFANVVLHEIIPFCNEEGCGDSFKKVIIENNTFIIGIGTITRLQT